MPPCGEEKELLVEKEEDKSEVNDCKEEEDDDEDVELDVVPSPERLIMGTMEGRFCEGDATDILVKAASMCRLCLLGDVGMER
jgi:hypothetical protein